MGQKHEPASAPASEEAEVYYVEDVDGADFTFYLDLEGNQKLLRGFSRSTKLTVVKIPPLLSLTDLINDDNNLLGTINQALDQAKTQSESENKWGKLIAKFSHEIKTEIRKDWQKESKETPLLEAILKELNQLLTAEDLAELLGKRDDLLSQAEQDLIENFSAAGRLAYRNRKTLNDYFEKEIRPFEPQLSGTSGRALICRSFQGKLLSVSFREKSQKSSYRPDDSPSDKYPLTIKDYCDELYRAIEGLEKRGLLVITGETNSSKSEIATGLIHRYLKERKLDLTRPPHLVTFEDPIEKFFGTAGVSKAFNLAIRMPAAESGIDYTPREKGNVEEKNKDVVDLNEALEDALRQTPTILFVGETRDKRDWRRLVDFASTGHLIVTTAHAGSLTEAMHKIFEALKVKTPAERSEIANRLLGVVHIKNHPGTKILVPTLWRRTPTGKSALIAEGLSSLLPYKPEKTDTEKGCLGRYWFAENLLEKIDESKLDKEAMKKETIEWDLEGV